MFTVQSKSMAISIFISHAVYSIYADYTVPIIWPIFTKNCSKWRTFDENLMVDRLAFLIENLLKRGCIDFCLI